MNQDKAKIDAEATTEEKVKADVKPQTEEKTEADVKPETEEKVEADVKLETEEKVEADVKLETEEKAETKKKARGKKKKWIVFFLLAALLAVVLIAYGSVAVYFQTHFLPGTRVNGMDCSQLEVQTVARMLEQQVLDYELSVIGRDVNDADAKSVLGTISAEEMGLQLVDTEDAVALVLEQQNELLWIVYYMGQKQESHSIVQGVTFDKTLVEESVKEWEAFQKKNMIAPKDAYISEYSDATGQYELIEEVKGTTLDVDKALEQMEVAIVGKVTEIDLDEGACYQDAEVTAEDAALQECLESVNKWVKANITYDWNGTKVELGKEQIQQWITIEGNQAVLDEEAVAAFVEENARQWDTYGKNRNFMTTLGIELTLPSGAFGWLTDREAETKELITLIQNGETTEREPIYSVRGFRKGNNDIGNSYVEIDLTHQHLYVYINGAIVVETDFVSGLMTDPGCVTPAGVFGLTYKTTNAVLRGADYEEPVSFWMPFHGNFGMHDATWRTEFGGDIYLENGSHGCINLPLEAAGQIYNYVYTGFPVICYYY